MEGIDYDSQLDVISSILVNHYLPYEERMIAVRNCYNALKKEGIYITFENFAPRDETTKKMCIRDRIRREKVVTGFYWIRL